MKKQDISNKTLREMVYEELKDQILKGKLPAGTRLMEIDLSNKMGASRTPVREAIRMLAEDNLVVLEQNKGAYVSKIAVRDLLDILEIRETLDGTATYHCAERITEEYIEKLRMATENYEKALESGNRSMMIKWDTNFHRIIVEATGNKVMVKISEEIRELVLRFRYIYFGDFKRAEPVSKEHRDIYEAIISRNPKEAREKAELHIRNIRASVMKEYENL